ncbi:MAG: hemin uptake protein HemP [Betaproteobacteria bacterium]|nr:hemin uptake protein HemP [Betaproteobacteria bacterium]
MNARAVPAKTPAAPAQEAGLRKDGDPAPIRSAALLQGRDAITIDHNGRLYQLRQTRQGKLILTK